MKKIERLMGIVLKIYIDKRVTAKELSDLFEVNIRTIYRDIEAICEMNVPIVALTGNNGGYSLMDNYFIPPIIFSEDETFALLLSRKIIENINIPGYSEYINSAFLKIRNNMNEEQNKKIEGVEEKILFDIQCKNIEKERIKYFNIIKKGIEESIKISIEYFNPHQLKITKRLIHPYGIIFQDGAWYIIAFCELRNENRCFRLDRIERAICTGKNFKLPEGFNLEKYKNESDYIKALELERSYEIKLKIKDELYNIVKDYYYIKYGQVTKKRNYYIVKVKTLDPESYIRRAFQFSDGLEVLEPLWLRKKIKDEVESLYKIYEK